MSEQTSAEMPVRDWFEGHHAALGIGADRRVSSALSATVSLADADVGSFTVAAIERFPAGKHPLSEEVDAYHMGSGCGVDGLVLAHAGGESRFGPAYVILAHQPSGWRLKVTIGDTDRGPKFVSIGGFIAVSSPGVDRIPAESGGLRATTLTRQRFDPDTGSLVRGEEEPWLVIRARDARSVLLEDPRGDSLRRLLVALPQPDGRGATPSAVDEAMSAAAGN